MSQMRMIINSIGSGPPNPEIRIYKVIGQLMLEARSRDDEIAASACMDAGGQIRTQPVYQCAFFCTINSRVYP